MNRDLYPLNSNLGYEWPQKEGIVAVPQIHTQILGKAEYHNHSDKHLNQTIGYTNFRLPNKYLFGVTPKALLLTLPFLISPFLQDNYFV